MKTFLFGDTGEAYDACQCDENIKNGDTLLIVEEKVAGLAWAWPIAVTEEAGAFHWIDDTEGAIDGVLADMDVEPDAMLEAIAAAEARGWPIRPAIAEWKKTVVK